MPKIAYLDCPTGIAGDMCLGALVDAGVPLDYLLAMLSRLGIEKEYHLWAEDVQRNGQRATKVHVDLSLNVFAHHETDDRAHTKTEHSAKPHLHSATEQPAATETDAIHTHSHDSDLTRSQHSHSHETHTHGQASTATDRPHDLVRHLPEVERLILAAALPARAEAWSLAVFRKLAEAEGAIHGVPPEQVHFHEVGATDAIVDIVGTCLGLDWLGIDRLYCSPLPTGGGTIRAAHGRLPVPAPAVLKLFELRQVPIYSNGIEREMVTPTGAAIATTLATQFGAPPAMTLLRVGLGAGSISLPLPNILRLWIGEEKGEAGAREAGEVKSAGAAEDQKKLKTQNSKLSSNAAQRATQTSQTIALLETQIDDLNPQAIGYIYEALFAVGAVDVFTQAIGMKKARPGVLLTVVCHPEDVSACEGVIFRETTTLGIRRSLQQRTILYREMQTVETVYGAVQVKVAWRDRADTHPINVQPEYEDCAAIARQQQLPWREVHSLVLQNWHQQHSGASKQLF
ncbi:nickel pincer cofactor biosynthesis protein LarC [Phormidium sp. FACHB-592]|uniref:Putative nickel insertion protein n=1 Tax=Stenomitos frigidus AS-A4 TaxID=2933935 RepID=A0ABV0KTZ3_9CYAN|nr:nickel pincer cofactor biosynthesis protein LarC [Phormidium sp. FACHB-592]MBD2076802.1 nickel pincer cofactor biosynthesis protein LarC [Phormidium sp. FACHB-592]